MSYQNITSNLYNKHKEDEKKKLLLNDCLHFFIYIIILFLITLYTNSCDLFFPNNLITLSL